MYSVVLLAALSTGTSTPACHWGSWRSACCGCYGGNTQACWGCQGYQGCYGCYGCYGGYGCYGCYSGYGYGYQSSYSPVYVAPTGQAAPEAIPAPKKEEPKAPEAKQARLIIDVPEDARVYIDGQLMKTGAAHRVFRTPALEKNQTYYYIVRAEVIRDGKTQSQTRRVIIRAGDEVQTAFVDLPATGTATAAR